MKAITACKTFAYGIGLAVIFLFLSSANAQFHARILSLNDLTLQLKTPDAVANYMWHNFKFENDRRQFGQDDYWQSPEKMLENQKGDCEDFAIFAYHVLRRNGVKAFLMNVYGRRFAHTVCVFKENGRYNIIDGTKVHYYRAADLKDIARKIYPFWNKAALVNFSAASEKPRLIRQITP